MPLGAIARVGICTVAGLVAWSSVAWSQQPPPRTPSTVDDQPPGLRSLSFTEQLLERKIDEQMLFQALADIAVMDRVRYTGPPPRVAKNPTAPEPRIPSSSKPTRFYPRNT